MRKSHPPKRDGAKRTGVSDPRFANFETDPRFRLPSKKNNKVVLDKRFANVLEDPDFTPTAKVDRYGRKLKSDTNKKALQRLYRVEDENESAGDDTNSAESESEEIAIVKKKYDPARGVGLGSSSESESDDDEESGSDDDEEEHATESRGMQRIQDDTANAEEGEVTNRIAIVRPCPDLFPTHLFECLDDTDYRSSRSRSTGTTSSPSISTCCSPRFCPLVAASNTSQYTPPNSANLGWRRKTLVAPRKKYGGRRVHDTRTRPPKTRMRTKLGMKMKTKKSRNSCTRNKRVTTKILTWTG
jgi:hypothetical protein